MTDLIAVLSTGKGTWAEVNALIKSESWDNIYLISNKFGEEKFSSERPIKMIVLDDNMSIEGMKSRIVDELKGRLKMDVAVNIISGTGAEHMALLSALISMGVGLRLVIEKDGLREL